MTELYNLGIYHGTDKAEPHKYCGVYEKHLNFLKKENINLLEIGIYNGASLNMWHDYFESGIIYGADVNPLVLKSNSLKKDRIKLILGDQKDRSFLNSFSDNFFDVIIDDGGHTMEQQLVSFGCLFKKLKNGGIYILEDLITSFWEDYGGNKENKDTALAAIHDLKETHKINSDYLLESEKKHIEEHVKEVYIYGAYGDETVSTKAITSIIIKK